MRNNKIDVRHLIQAMAVAIPLQLISTAGIMAQGGMSHSSMTAISPPATLNITRAQYEDKVHAIWVSQMAAAIMGFQFEHRTASVEWVDQLPDRISFAPVDDDWYYEMAAVRAFEKYGINMSVEQLGQQWKENNCGSWGSSEQARLLIARGIRPPETGHPRYNKLWFTIGPQFSADVYGALAPAQPNVAAKMAREYGHINGYAEGTDGAVFMAGMISIGFVEKDPHIIVKKAASLLNPRSPFRKCVDMVIKMGESGKSSRDVFDAVEDRWHIEYPATNNAVPNGGIVAASVWFGEGDYLKTVNLAFGAADFTDADCNAANAASVIGAMYGLAGIPDYLVKRFGDRIKGDKMGGVTLTPAVDESISGLAHRTAVIGEKILVRNGAEVNGNAISIPIQQPITQEAELFDLSMLTQYWNPEWSLNRAGVGGAGGGMGGIRGNTYLDGDVLATYPRDEVRGLDLRRDVTVNGQKTFSFDAGVDPKRFFDLSVYIGNKRVLQKNIEGTEDSRHWEHITVDLGDYQGKTVTIRVYQRVLVHGKEAGNAYWKNFTIQ